MTRALAIALCVVFFLAGLSLIPLLGIQNDEALFAYGVFPPRAGAYMLHLGAIEVPLMMMSYVGALKSWIYLPVFALFGTGVWSVRVPMLLAGAVGVWLFYLFLRRVAGERAAVAGCALLAVDASYLLTATFDWGPVALQHLLVVGGLVLLARFWQQRQEWALAAGFLVFGLALWDKASAIWSLAGLALGSVAVLPREIRQALTARRGAVAALAFILGAMPLIAYNVRSRAQTFHDTVARETGGIGPKARVLMRTADGSLLFGWLLDGDAPAPHPSEPHTALERVSAAGASLTGNPKSNLMLYAFGAALLLAPLASGHDRRAILFALIAMAAIWTQMELTSNAGAGAHHAILLWPLPQMVIAVSFAAASRRLGRAGKPALAATLAILMTSQLAVLNEYRVLMARNGGAVNWTDAIDSLSSYLWTAPAREMYCVDWGLLAGLHLLSRGRLPLVVGWEELGKAEWTPADRARITAMVAQPGAIFLGHTADLELFHGFGARLEKFAESLDYRRDRLTVIADRHGRPTFEVYRFVAGTREGAGSTAPRRVRPLVAADGAARRGNTALPAVHR
jgi:4-amino-4-deoxy-L-arabinose transferase-like glycosyltransferase